MIKISVILPVYNEEGNILILYNRLKMVLEELSYTHEIIFVSDGSTDGSENIIKKLMVFDSNIKLLSFTRNFGHQMALIAGLNHSVGDMIIIMDSDLQHPPELIKNLIGKWEDGYEIVNTLRIDINQKGYLKKITSKYFYKLFSYISDIQLEGGSADFKLFDRKVVDSIKNLHENDIFLRGIIQWFGYSQTSISYIPDERWSGKTKYSIGKMIKFAISGITSFSVVPLRLVIYMGFIVAGLSFVYLIINIYNALILKINISGYTTTIISILFLGGIQLISLGVIGEYIGKILFEVKQRPKYILKKQPITLL